jgi:hypothetical protein
MSDKLNINNEMAQMDLKNRGFYDELTDEERKKFSTYLMLRWGSAVSGPRELQEYYLLSTNQNMNRHFFDIPKAHDKLKWLMATTVSPGMGKQRHEWIAAKGKGAKNKMAKLLAELYPAHKTEDLEVLADSLSDEDIKTHLKALGWDDRKIKEAMK